MIFERRYTKDKITFTKTAEESNGEMSVLYTEVYSGGGPPLHYHKEITQTFKVLEGTLYLTVHDKVHTLKPGDVFIVPPMVPHGEASVKGEVLKCVVEIRPGHKGYEDFMNLAYNDSPDRYTPEQKQKIYLNADTYRQ